MRQVCLRGDNGAFAPGCLDAGGDAARLYIYSYFHTFGYRAGESVILKESEGKLRVAIEQKMAVVYILPKEKQAEPVHCLKRKGSETRDCSREIKS